MGELSRYDDGTYRRHNPTWHSEDSQWKATKVVDLLRAHGITPASLCEIGCGAGAILRWLEQAYGPGCRFAGYDVSADALVSAQQYGSPSIAYVHGDFPPAEAGAFDVVLAMDVIEHVEDCFGFLRRLRLVGRHKVLHIPLDLSVQGVWRGSPLFRVRENLGHLHYFTKDTALATLREAGLRVIDHRYTCGSLDLPAKRMAVRLMRAPRRLLAAANVDFAARLLGGFSLLVLAE